LFRLGQVLSLSNDVPALRQPARQSDFRAAGDRRHGAKIGGACANRNTISAASKVGRTSAIAIAAIAHGNQA
jgi:hypothetical protein